MSSECPAWPHVCAVIEHGDLTDDRPVDPAQIRIWSPLIVEAVNRAADETDDVRDHDELHAAADIMKSGAVGSEYINRWLDEIVKRTLD